jgi:hypothetical protein
MANVVPTPDIGGFNEWMLDLPEPDWSSFPVDHASTDTFSTFGFYTQPKWNIWNEVELFCPSSEQGVQGWMARFVNFVGDGRGVRRAGLVVDGTFLGMS